MRALGLVKLTLITASICSAMYASAEDATSNPATNPATGAPVAWGELMMGGMPYSKLLIDRLEAGFGNADDTYLWDAQAWYGTDWNKVWLKTEGEGVQGESAEEAELQLLYSRLFSPFWIWQLGARHDFKPDKERSFAVVGLQGMIPYMIETDANVFVSDEGDVSFRLELEYDVNITQRMILQPRLELNAAASDVHEVGVGSGLNDTEMGLRLRYEIRRELAPYVGVSWTRLYGDTADFARDEGEDDSNLSVVVGVRAWF